MTNTATATSSASVEIDAEKLREMRQDQGLTQKDLAKISGITAQYLGQLENRHRLRVSPPVFARLCDSLGIEATERRVLRKTARSVA